MQMLNMSFNLSHLNSLFSYFRKDVEDWFDYGKLNVLVI